MFNKNKNPFFHYYYKNRNTKTPGKFSIRPQKISKTKRNQIPCFWEKELPRIEKENQFFSSPGTQEKNNSQE